MTFIASVVARDGVAIIADSLVTTSSPVINFSDFLDYVSTKTGEGDEIQVDLNELSNLFKNQDSFTRDFEEKIFEYDHFTAITTAGNAQINDMRIKDLVAKKKAINIADGSFNGLSILEKVTDFCAFVEAEIKENALSDEFSLIGTTVFIFTHYEPTVGTTTIYHIQTVECSAESFNDPDFKAVPVPPKTEAKIVCDGQNRISNGILYGGIETVVLSVNKTLDILADEFGFDRSLIDTDNRRRIIRSSIELIDENIQLRKISELSLQQAVDLAALLMRIEIDFQKYTSNIPTVGGLIKMAIINQEGFRFLTGNEIIRPSFM